MQTIETSILTSLVYDDEFCRKVYPYLKPEYFEDTAHRSIFDTFAEIFDEYNTIPNINALAVTINKKSIVENDYNNIVDTLDSMLQAKSDLPDTQWLLDETEQYCQDRAIYNAVFESIEIINGSNKKLDKHAIPELLGEALSIGFDQNIGMEYFDDWERRYDFYTNEETLLKFPIPELNRLSNGGLRPATLNILMGDTNSGKSLALCYLAGEWVKQGKNVLYISMEMSEESVQERIDANLLNCKTDDLKLMSKEDFGRRVKTIQNKTIGRFFVKNYPTGSAHAGHFRHLIKELNQKKKFKPDIIIVDYLSICASSRYKSMGSVNGYSYNKAIAEELRGLAVECNVPMLSAVQTNREGAKKEKGAPDLTSTADSYGIPATADWMASIYIDDIMREKCNILISLLKTRYGNKANINSQLIGVDYDHQKYYSLNSNEDVRKNISAPVIVTDKGKKKAVRNLEEVDWSY